MRPLPPPPVADPTHRFRRQAGLRMAAGLVIALASVPLWLGAAMAQTAPVPSPPPRAKPTPKLPPSPAEQTRIPAGVDSGTPATSDTMPLGTAVPPTAAADQNQLREQSAAARAAARRPAPTAASAASGVAGADAPAPVASGAAERRAARVSRDCAPGGTGAPVALPGSGFTGQSASPAEQRQLASAKKPGC